MLLLFEHITLAEKKKKTSGRISGEKLFFVRQLKRGSMAARNYSVFFLSAGSEKFCIFGVCGKYYELSLKSSRILLLLILSPRTREEKSEKDKIEKYYKF